jgi:hypothetical protein
MSHSNEFSTRLMNSIQRLDSSNENPADRALAKMEMLQSVAELMPGGVPRYTEMVKFPKISDLVQTRGRAEMHKILAVLVQNFCNSFNVVRNMNEDQIFEAAAMLLDECTNFRVEDYTVMFTQAKRGELVKVYDRIDLSVISELMDKYFENRAAAARIEQEKEAQQYDSMGSNRRIAEDINPGDGLPAGSTLAIPGMDELMKKMKGDE